MPDPLHERIIDEIYEFGGRSFKVLGPGVYIRVGYPMHGDLMKQAEHYSAFYNGLRLSPMHAIELCGLQLRRDRTVSADEFFIGEQRFEVAN